MTRESREQLLERVVHLYDEARLRGSLAAEELVDALGWQHPIDMPPPNWLRIRLGSAFGLKERNNGQTSRTDR